MKKLLLAILTCLAVQPAHAGSYILQSTFTLGSATIGGLDRDLVGNLYVFALPAGATTYKVTGYQTQGITPLFSFDTGISTFAAFAVEDSGIVDVIDVSSGYALKRFTNTGAFLGVSTYTLTTNPYITPQYISAAIDKRNQRVYLTLQVTQAIYRVQCLGCTSGPSSVTNGYINQYDFSGNQILSIQMAGNNNAPGTCYTPESLTTDAGGNIYVGDPSCQQVVEYTPAGTPTTTIQASQWTTDFSPRHMWMDSASSIYISQPVCSPVSCPWGIVKLTGSSFQTSFVADSAVGVAWDPRILFLNSSGAQPLRRFIFDNAPSVPPETAPIGATGQHSTSAPLAWNASTDADGDPVVYSVSLGTSPSQLAFSSGTSLNSYSSQPLNFGTTYFWQVTAQDSYLGLPMQTVSAPVESFNLSFLDSPPGAFAVASGTGTAVTRSTSVTLGWTPATDLYGDPLTYNVTWQPTGESSATVAATAANSLSVIGLAFGTTVYWSATACDPYGECTPMTGGTQTYLPVFQNLPPSTMTITGGTGVMAEHTLSPSALLSWLPVTDPEKDPISFLVEIGTSPSSLYALQPITITSDSISGLGFATTYYWTVSASNPYGAASTSSVQSLLVVLQNNPPGPFSAVAGTGTLTTRTTAQLLAWGASTDPDGDTVTYALALSTSPGSLAVVQTSTAMSFLLSAQFGTTYYWSVAAFDGFGGTTTITGGTQSLLATFLDQGPQAVQIPQPVLTTMRGNVTVSWQQVTNAEGDPTSYTVYFGNSAGSLQAFAQIAPAASGGAAAQSLRVMETTPQAQSQISGSTVTLTLTGLAYYQPYYVQIQATDPFGGTSLSPVQTFTLSSESGFPLAYNYPNPFSPLRGGTNIVFNAPPSGYTQATVEVYSEWQKLLFKQDYFNIPPGVSQVPFGGQDRYGRPLFNGSYICRVRFSGPGNQAIFYLLVVK